MRAIGGQADRRTGFLDIARASLSELSYLLRFSKDRGILGIDDYRYLEQLREEAGKMAGPLRLLGRKVSYLSACPPATRPPARLSTYPGGQLSFRPPSTCR
jgi:hypothetical protein